ncbi:MAG: RNase adapter RapZ [Erysipelothrix sp.]|nr:RNase adapter RapZ [Erysipelothrix sp.]
MNLLILTGMSGSGKSTAMKALEDIGYYCIDNYPPSLVKYIPTVVQDYQEKSQNVAITLDIRSFLEKDGMHSIFEELEDTGVLYRTLFLDSSDDVLLRRYKETRRNHPLMEKNHLDLEGAIKLEREYMNEVKYSSNYVFDTSHDGTAQLKQKISQTFGDGIKEKLRVNLVSFGFKFGILKDADLIFDVRCLKNPFYVAELKNKTGESEDVRDYVMSTGAAKGLYKQIEDYLNYSIPLYHLEGKSQLVVGIACTGGKHRSVTFAKLLSQSLKFDNAVVQEQHRDIDRK